MLGYSPIQFVNEYGRSLSAELLRTGIASSSFTSDWEVEEAIKLLTQNETLRIFCLVWRNLKKEWKFQRQK